MDKVLCQSHGAVCMLKTGVKDGPNKGKSFYVCVDKAGCGFSQPASLPPSHCLQHEDSTVELQALTYSQQQKTYRLFYRCIVGKKAGQKWCGNVPWTNPHKDQRNPLAESQLQPSCVAPVRNPFKAPASAQDSAWRKIQSGDPRTQAKENERLGLQTGSQHRVLPPGMKVKKCQIPGEGRETRAEGKETRAEGKETRAEGKETKAEGSKDQSTDRGKLTKAEVDQALSTVPAIIPALTSYRERPQEPEDEDEVVLVSVLPPPQKAPIQKALTTFPGFQKAPKPPSGDSQGLRSLLSSQLQQKKATLAAVNLGVLPDKGARLKTQVKELEDALDALCLTAPSEPGPEPGVSSVTACAPLKPCSRPGGTVLLPAPPQTAQLQSQAQAQAQALYGGRMTEDRLLAVKNATCEAIEHMHASLETCPGADSEAPEPPGIKVPLMAHQKRALAWLLWREEKNPCGGILADDMGLGKTLTMIALILAKKSTQREAGAEAWISKKDSSLVSSRATLIVCPASLVHHWKKEVERHVRPGKLSVYLYHGPNREKKAKILAEHDVVVTTYGLVSKEMPPPKDCAEDGGAGADAGPVARHASPLLRVSWARIILDEAHNIKNPKVQTSVAVCQLRAGARWAVTGTPIQNNLLDMYSLLKFLRCSPFDEFKLWKAQVDNGSKRGRERLNILTKTLLLRRTKDQQDATGKPLVSLPQRCCQLHQLTLSEDEQAVYDVLFAQSRSTLQNYLQRHEGQKLDKGSAANPFDKVAQEFGMSQPEASQSLSQSLSSSQTKQASSTVHILSLLLRLRQCCCHLSLLRKTLQASELQGDGVVLSLEEQLCALSLSSSPDPAPAEPNPEHTVSLNGTRFHPQLFEDSRESTKMSAIVSELMAIRQRGPDHKSVIVSQWTSMLHIVAVHLQQMDLSFAVIDGTVLPKKRMDLVEDFNTNPHGPQVMLVSLCAGGVGLNLVGGNHLFLMDLHWNPALEDQACDRIYRVGQRKDVTIHRFVCVGTVEEKISTLQAKKKELAQNVLSGTGSTQSKLSLADLRVIFGV
ncbi:unnamed protein product [Knipowitschia caucasica]|uniref:Transcription termination factor 2 n=1 Tax=Knipowitschia caucasica TaxID=637954 RepID=A0AAV2JY62_KNICA